MANEYCTIEEACELLGKAESDVRALVAEGKLRELRDAGKTFYRRDEVRQLAAKEGSSIVELAPTDDVMPSDEDVGGSFSSALSSLKDESSSMGILDQSPTPMAEDAMASEEQAEPASASSFKLAQDDEDASPLIELTADSFPEHLPAAEKESAAEEDDMGVPTELTSEIDLLPSAEDSAVGLSPLGGISPDIGLSPATEADDAVAQDLEVPDLGLSGSSIISLEPTLDDVTPSPAKPVADVGGKKGISVFDEDELQIDADPMGETRISAGIEELEAVGSGSGLLDITQESDDTSLGAALLDVISPTETSGETAVEGEPEIISAEAEETAEDSGAIMAAEEPAEIGYEEAAAAAPTAVMAPPRAASMAAMAGAVPMNICLITAVVSLAVVGLATAGQIQGVWPSFLDFVAKDVLHYSVFGGLGAIVLGTGIWSILAGRK